MGVGGKGREGVNMRRVLKLLHVFSAAKHRKQRRGWILPHVPCAPQRARDHRHYPALPQWRWVPDTEKITDTRNTVSAPFREFCVSKHTSLMNVCCLEILDPHNYWPGIVAKLSAWLDRKWLRDIDDSELFFSSEISVAESPSWSHNARSKILMWPLTPIASTFLRHKICLTECKPRDTESVNRQTLVGCPLESRISATGLINVLPQKCDLRLYFLRGDIRACSDTHHMGHHINPALSSFDGVDVLLPATLITPIFPTYALRSSPALSSFVLFPPASVPAVPWKVTTFF